MTASGSVVVTGYGALCGVGAGWAALRDALVAGRDGIRPLARFDTQLFSTGIAAAVPGRDGPEGMTADGKPDPTLWLDLGVAAVREALATAQLTDRSPARFALIVGHIRGHLDGRHDLAARLGERLGLDALCVDVGTACASSAHAIGIARDLVLDGRVDVAIAGGVDVITPDVFAGFDACSLLAKKSCGPFGETVGTTLGEGAAFLVLESESRAASRGHRALGSVLGYGLSADAHHPSAPDPSGGGLARAISSALVDAGLRAAEVGYVNAHGTGTAANDSAEALAIDRALGGCEIPVSSTKSIIGHAQGAAGALEAIATLLGLDGQWLPPTLHVGTPRPRAPRDLVSEGRARPNAYEVALSSSAGFGGANAVLALGRKPRVSERPKRRVFVVGGGAIGPQGSELPAFTRSLGTRSDGARVPPFDMAAVVPLADPRAFDPTARYLTVAAARALEDGRVSLRGAARERAGLFVACAQLSPTSGREYFGSAERRGLRRVSATAFTRIVLNAPAGACALALGLRGPTTTLAAGAASGLLAIVHAADFLAARADCDWIVAGGVDELPDGAEHDREGSEGAGCLCLASHAGEDGVELVGAGLAAAGQIEAAVDDALARAAVAHVAIDLVVGEGSALRCAPSLPHARVLDLGSTFAPLASSRGALAAVAALVLMRQGEARRALVVADAPGALSCAALLVRGGARDGR